MQGGRGGGDPFFNFGDPFGGFGGFGGFGNHRSLLSNFLGGRDPFADPFFSQPHGSMFDSNIFGSSGIPFPQMPTGFLEHQVPQPNRSRGPIIEEINSDDENEGGAKEKKENPRKHGRSSKEAYVEDPDDVAEERKSKLMQYRNDYNRLNNSQAQPQTRSFSFQSSSVSYGGSNGTYYTSSRTRRMGSDGVMIDESKEADTTTGEATHKLARGIHDKGHSTTRKLKSDGNVDTMQILHNLNEDELPVFEEAWNGAARKHLPGWSERLNDRNNMGSGSGRQNFEASGRGWALPSTAHSEHLGKVKPDKGDKASASRSQQSGGKKAFKPQ